MPHPKPIAVTLLALAALLVSTAGESESDAEREARQAELDRACEAAREDKLRPLRQHLVQQCVDEGEFESREVCQAYYADYGARSGNRAPLFYDLPPCVEAFEYAQSERSSG